MSTIDHHHRRVSRGFTLLALAAVLAVTAAALSRCRPVGDSVAGVDLTTANPKLNHRSDCVRQCNKDFNQAHTEEVERHAAARLAERLGARVDALLFLIELKGLGGREKLEPRRVEALLEYEVSV